MRLYNPILRAALAATLLAASAVGCSDATTSPGDTTRFSVYLKDAPGEVLRAVVTIDRVYLQGGSDAADEDSTTAGDMSPRELDAARGRVVLTDEDVTVDLLTLVDEPMALLQNVSVPSGRYSGLRFVVTGGFIEVEGADGTSRIYASSPDYAGLPAGAVVTGQLRMPSFRSSGLKVQLPGPIELTGDSDAILVDFDVRQSFGGVAGNSGAWIMRPTIKGERTTPPAAP